VLADNRVMLGLARGLGFETKLDAGSGEVVVRLELQRETDCEPVLS